MKIIHFADLHIGVDNYGRIEPETNLNSRTQDILKGLDYLVDFALTNNADMVLFCGDAYKSREPSPTQQREFAKRISRLSSAGIPVFLLVGNHDLPNTERKATSTEIFSTLSVKNVYVSSRPEVLLIPTKNGIIQVATLPWVRRSGILRKEDIKGLNIDQINQRLQKSLSNIIGDLAKKVDPSIPALLAAHVWVGSPSRKTNEGTEKYMTLGQEHSLLVSNIAHPVFDFIALGHIHVSQVLNNTPPVVYAGSLVKLDFGDEGDEKGFYEIEIKTRKESDNKHTTYRFIPVKGRRFLTIRLTLASHDLHPTNTVIQAIIQQKHQIADAIVRLQLEIPSELVGSVNDVEIRNALKDAHYLTISKNIRHESRLRLGDIATEGLEPTEILTLWLESKKVSPERRAILLQYGRELIQAENDK